MVQRTSIVCTFMAVLLAWGSMGCDNVYDSAKPGFPSIDSSGPGGDCEEDLRLFDTFPPPGTTYLFGDIESVEPILDGVRAHGNAGAGEDYMNEKEYTCDSFGIAALRITFSNVKAPWDGAPTTAVVDVTATSLDSLTTSPRIQKGTHKLQWSVSEGKKPRFPGRGDRIGVAIYGKAHGDHLATSFRQVLEVHEDGTVTRHLGGDCVAFDAQRYPTEEAVLTALRENPDYATLDLTEDYTWRTTSICEKH